MFDTQGPQGDLRITRQLWMAAEARIPQPVSTTNSAHSDKQ
jgi:hypothetical protein